MILLVLMPRPTTLFILHHLTLNSSTINMGWTYLPSSRSPTSCEFIALSGRAGCRLSDECRLDENRNLAR